MDFVGKGEGGKIWENGIETCKISCMKRDASPGSMHDTGCLGLVHWGGRREEGSGWGTHVYLWRIHFDIWQNYYNYVKFKNKIKLKKIKFSLIHFKVYFIVKFYLYWIVIKVVYNFCIGEFIQFLFCYRM